MRISARLTPRTRVSMGPLGWAVYILVILPVAVVFWLVVTAARLAARLGMLAVRQIRA